MRIIDLLKKESIVPNAKVGSKAEAIELLIDLHEQAGDLTDKEEYKKGILAREEEGTTAVGEGIAIPHAKSAAVKQAGLTAITAAEGVDYQAPDGKPSNILFMIAAPLDGDLHFGSVITPDDAADGYGAPGGAFKRENAGRIPCGY